MLTFSDSRAKNIIISVLLILLALFGIYAASSTFRARYLCEKIGGTMRYKDYSNCYLPKAEYEKAIVGPSLSAFGFSIKLHQQ